MRFILSVVVAVAPVGVAVAADQPGPVRPVEQIIEDVDPLQRSLRRLEPGIGASGIDSDSHVYQSSTPGGDPTQFYYIRPGVIAQYNRSDYVTVEKRGQQKTYQLVGPNTVYLLGGLPRATGDAETQVPSPQMVQARITGRVDDAGTKAGDGDDAGPGIAQQWQAYQRFRESQRRAVLGALDRAAKQPEAKPQTAPATPTPAAKP